MVNVESVKKYIAEKKAKSNLIFNYVSKIIPRSKRNKYISEFVKTQKALEARVLNRLVWNSTIAGTYRRAKHGELS